MDYDLAGRITQQVFPDTRMIQYTYDANGNLTAIVPPGRDAHVFDYTAMNLEERHTPPLLGSDLTITQYTYNRDKQLDLVTRPDGQSFNPGALAGSIIGGGLGAGRAYGAGSDTRGLISGGVLAAGPALAAGAMGTALGGGFQ